MYSLKKKKDILYVKKEINKKIRKKINCGKFIARREGL